MVKYTMDGRRLCSRESKSRETTPRLIKPRIAKNNDKQDFEGSKNQFLDDLDVKINEKVKKMTEIELERFNH